MLLQSLKLLGHVRVQSDFLQVVQSQTQLCKLQDRSRKYTVTEEKLQEKEGAENLVIEDHEQS